MTRKKRQKKRIYIFRGFLFFQKQISFSYTIHTLFFSFCRIIFYPGIAAVAFDPFSGSSSLEFSNKELRAIYYLKKQSFQLKRNRWRLMCSLNIPTIILQLIKYVTTLTCRNIMPGRRDPCVKYIVVFQLVILIFQCFGNILNCSDWNLKNSFVIIILFICRTSTKNGS